MEKFKDLAESVASTFKAEAEAKGFKTFAEMCRAYDWNGASVQQEICKRVEKCGGSHYSDLSRITIFSTAKGWDDMDYGEFKKVVLARLK